MNDNIPCRVTADLRTYEAIQDRLEQAQAALEARAEPVFDHIMRHLDSDVLDEAFAQISKEEYSSLEEDIGRGPMRDLAHAGLILSDIVERCVLRMAIKEVS